MSSRALSMARRARPLFVLLGTLVLRGAAAHGAPAPTPRLELHPCTLPGVAREVRCGTYDVFEDRAAASGRKITLHVAVLPATGTERVSDPIFFFAGGPGQSAIDQAAGIVDEQGERNRKRDIVLVDVRGTGASNGLQCKALAGKQGVLGFLTSFLPVDGVKACRAELESRADLRLYTTAPIVDDVDDVRAALGYERVNLAGGSYGTLAALTYLRRHPERVRTAALFGVVTPDTRMPLHFAHDAQLALDQVFAACARDAACHAAFPDPRHDLEVVLGGLAKAPAQVTVRDGSTGQPITFPLTAGAVEQAVRYMLYEPPAASEIPLELHLAAQGDFRPLGDTAYEFGRQLSGVGDGLYLSVTCAEDVPFYTPEEASREAQGTFLGDFRARAQKAACAEWPRGAVPPGFDAPVRSDAPVLLVSGERDPVTPAYAAETAARTLAHSVRVVVPGGGHSMDGLGGIDCLGRVYGDFIDRGSEQGVDTSCVAKIVPVPFALADTRPKEVPLTSAELDRCVGTYVGEGGTQVVVRRAGDVLQAVFGPGPPSLLIPLSAKHFAIGGAPNGFFFDFEIANGAAATLHIQEGPNQSETLRRKP
jgi:pimeloyl-ACP methyl ester carboxylesterase